MTDKYYTPEIEEFYVGFEFEYKDHNGSKRWHKAVIDGETHSFKTPYVYETRVKHLDKEDIESLGFKENMGQEYYSMLKGVTKIAIESLSPPNFYRMEIEHHIMFFTIKNKSELKKVLKMIGV